MFPLYNGLIIIKFDAYRRPHRIELSLHGYTPLFCAIAISLTSKATYSTCKRFPPISNISDIFCATDTFSYQYWSRALLISLSKTVVDLSLITFAMIKSSLFGYTIYMQLISMEAFDVIRQQKRRFYFNHSFCCITQWVPPLFVRERLKPTELCDGNYHRNKTIKSWSNSIQSLHSK